jgi:hypothetical protein
VGGPNGAELRTIRRSVIGRIEGCNLQLADTTGAPKSGTAS